MRLSDDDPATGELAVDLGDAAVLDVTEPADRVHDVEAEFVIGQGEMRLRLGPVGAEEAGTGGIRATADRQRQPEDAVEGREGAEVMVVGIGAVSAFGAIDGDGGQGQGAIRLRSWSLAFALWMDSSPELVLLFLRPPKAFQPFLTP